MDTTAEHDLASPGITYQIGVAGRIDILAELAGLTLAEAPPLGPVANLKRRVSRLLLPGCSLSSCHR